MNFTGNVCLSGGAEGADLQWGMCAGSAGHQVVHWTFKGHSSKAPKSEISELTEEQLLVADESLTRANLSLKRRFPGSSWFVNALLRRNYYQIKWAESVYAVSKLVKGQVDGGTAWATQMYMDRFLCDGEDISKCQLYLFDQVDEKWLTWNGVWQEAEHVPEPSGVWAGIGSRKLTDAGKQAIRDILGYSA